MLRDASWSCWTSRSTTAMGWWISSTAESAFIKEEESRGAAGGGGGGALPIGKRRGFRACTKTYKLVELYEIVQGG
jgi:hypothetical protein